MYMCRQVRRWNIRNGFNENSIVMHNENLIAERHTYMPALRWWKSRSLSPFLSSSPPSCFLGVGLAYSLDSHVTCTLKKRIERIPEKKLTGKLVRVELRRKKSIAAECNFYRCSSSSGSSRTSLREHRETDNNETLQYFRPYHLSLSGLNCTNSSNCPTFVRTNVTDRGWGG